MEKQKNRQARGELKASTASNKKGKCEAEPFYDDPISCNILQHQDIEQCLHETGADAVMSAEGNLSDPSIFAAPPLPGAEGREYWRGRYA